MAAADAAVRVATVAQAGAVAGLLDRFNREFGTPTPGSGPLEARLRGLLAGPGTLALLAGAPAVGVALVTLRSNVWYEGPVALLDELYVVPDRRGSGIGSALLAGVQDACRARGVALVEVNVDGEDDGARRFYERHGYANRDRGQTEPQLYYFRELGPA